MKQSFINTPDQRLERIIMFATETQLQNFMKSKYGLQLSNVELNRVAQVLCEKAFISKGLYNLFDHAVRRALDANDEEWDWEMVDASFNGEFET